MSLQGVKPVQGRAKPFHPVLHLLRIWREAANQFPVPFDLLMHGPSVNAAVAAAMYRMVSH